MPPSTPRPKSVETTRRSPGRTPGAPMRSSPSPNTRRDRSGRGSRLTPNASPSARTAPPSGRRSTSYAPAVTSSSWGRSNPERMSGALLRAYAELRARRPDAPALVLAGGVTPACASLLDDLARPPLAGHARHVGYVSGDGAGTPLSRGVDGRAALARRRLRAARPRSHDDRGSCRGFLTRSAPGGRRRRRPDCRPRRCRRDWPARWTGC